MYMKLWLDEPREFVRGAWQFVPRSGASFEYNFNAASRFVLYWFLLLCLVSEKQPVALPLYFAVGLAFAYYYYRNLRTRLFAPRCTPSTIDNPFMNVTHADYYHPDRPAACHDDAVEANFRNNLYENEEDFLNSSMLRRPFYTRPVTTIPNDSAAFHDALYGGADPCKTRGLCEINTEENRRNNGGVRVD